MIYMKRLRLNKGITMKKLGELVGVSESAISQYENLRLSHDAEYNLLAFFKRDMAFNHAPIFIFLQQ